MGKLNKKILPEALNKKSCNSDVDHQKPTAGILQSTLHPIKTSKSLVAVNKKKTKGKILVEKTIAPKKFKNKKEKLKIRRKNLAHKFELINKQKKEEMARKKREKTIITGDLRPLKDALPSLDELFAIKKEDLKSGIKSDENNKTDKKLNKTNKIKRQKEEFLNRYNCLSSMITDEHYRKNARELIAFHVQALKKNL